jgi:hypothetical protein
VAGPVGFAAGLRSRAHGPVPFGRNRYCAIVEAGARTLASARPSTKAVLGAQRARAGAVRAGPRILVTLPGARSAPHRFEAAGPASGRG